MSKFCSSKTNRGPLGEGWRDTTQPIMCSYKLVDVRFDMMYLLQGKIEQTVHNVRLLLFFRNYFVNFWQAIREILLVGHIQAFAWIDEWFGMTLQDVRDYEARMQEETNEKVRHEDAFVHFISICCFRFDKKGQSQILPNPWKMRQDGQLPILSLQIPPLQTLQPVLQEEVRKDGLVGVVSEGILEVIKE